MKTKSGKKKWLLVALCIVVIVLLALSVFKFLTYWRTPDNNIVGITIVNDTNNPIVPMYCTDFNNEGSDIIGPGRSVDISVNKNDGTSHNGCYIADPSRNNLYVGCVIPDKSVMDGDRYFISQMDTKTPWQKCGSGQ